MNARVFDSYDFYLGVFRLAVLSVGAAHPQESRRFAKADFEFDNTKPATSGLGELDLGIEVLVVDDAGPSQSHLVRMQNPPFTSELSWKPPRHLSRA